MKLLRGCQSLLKSVNTFCPYPTVFVLSGLHGDSLPLLKLLCPSFTFSLVLSLQPLFGNFIAALRLAPWGQLRKSKVAITQACAKCFVHITLIVVERPKYSNQKKPETTWVNSMKPFENDIQTNQYGGRELKIGSVACTLCGYVDISG